jgi:predicted GNAT superfamily acetyltransferase
MTGVMPEYRDQRIGYRLKLAQREWAIGRGLDLITWTYDPLESRNGYFNIHLLGCTCQTYLEDYYGSMSDQMNAGIPSDRFRVDWWITSPVVENALEEGGARKAETELQDILGERDYHLLNPVDRRTSDLPRPGSAALPLSSHRVLVEIPDQMQEIRSQDPSLALAWRLHSREIFQQLFLDDFQVKDFYYFQHPFPRSFYYLEKDHAD